MCATCWVFSLIFPFFLSQVIYLNSKCMTPLLNMRLFTFIMLLVNDICNDYPNIIYQFIMIITNESQTFVMDLE